VRRTVCDSRRIFSQASGCSDATKEIILFGDGFGADREGVQQTETQGIANGIVLPMAEIALAKNFHADNALPRCTHLADDRDDSFGIGIHVRADGIDPNEIHIHPGRLCCGAKSFDGVAGATMSANDAFLLGFRQNVHNGPVAGGPIVFGEAMHEEDINIIGTEFTAEAVQIGTHLGGSSSPGLGEDGDLRTVQVLQGLRNIGMAAVGVRGIEEAETTFVAMEKERDEALHTQSGLMGMMTAANRAGTHGEARGTEARASESYHVCGREFLAQGWLREKTVSKGMQAKKRGGDCRGRLREKFAAGEDTHKTPPEWRPGWPHQYRRN